MRETELPKGTPKDTDVPRFSAEQMTVLEVMMAKAKAVGGKKNKSEARDKGKGGPSTV